MRRRVGVLALLVMLATPAAATADGGWTSAQLPGAVYSGYWFRVFDTGLGMTAAGDVVAVWPNEAGDDPFSTQMLFAVKPRGAPMGAPEPLGGPGEIGSAHVLTDRNGGAVIWWPSVSGGIAFRERPPGGSFGPPQTVDTPGAWSAHMVGNAAGDLAVVWNTGAQFQVAIRPAGGSFGSPSPASPPLDGAPYIWAAALGGNRELTIAWVNDTPYNEPSTLRATHRGPAGELYPIDTLSDGTTIARVGGVASDASGRAVVAWEETPDAAYSGDRFMALRDSGQGFGARQRVAGQAPASEPLMAADGTYGIVALNSWGLRISAAPFAQKLQRIRSFSVSTGGDPPPVAVSPGGRIMLAGRGASSTYGPEPGRMLGVTAGGSLLGPVGPLQDLDAGCPEVSYQRTAVNDSGQAAVLYQSGSGMFVAVDDPADPIRRGCLTNWDGYDFDPEFQPARGGPGGGTWSDGVVYGAGPYGPGVPGMPLGPSMAPPVLPGLKLSATRLAGKGAKRTTRVTVTCVIFCTASASVELMPRRGEPLAEGRSKARGLRSGKGRIAVTMKLGSRARRALASPRTRRSLKVRVAVSAVDSIGRRRTQWVQTAAAPR